MSENTENGRSINVNVSAALKYIDLGNEEKAIELLQLAISQEAEKGDETAATEYRCVLGEYYANLGQSENARDLFNQVVNFCDETHTLGKQRDIAQTYLDIMDGKIDPAELEAANKAKRNPSVPLVPKPVQNKAFIAKQMNKRK